MWNGPIVELSINSTKPCHHDLNKIGGQPKSIFGSSLLTTICLDKFVIETLRLNTKVLEDNKHLDKHYCTQKNIYFTNHTLFLLAREYRLANVRSTHKNYLYLPWWPTATRDASSLTGRQSSLQSLFLIFLYRSCR